MREATNRWNVGSMSQAHRHAQPPEGAQGMCPAAADKGSRPNQLTCLNLSSLTGQGLSSKAEQQKRT